MMNSDNETNRNGGNDRDLLFSRTIKAGKRMYYLDVKRDRRDEYYIAMTESRRVHEGTETERPVFEKHKIFLYREDILSFLSAFTEAAKYIGENRPIGVQTRRPYNPEERQRRYNDERQPAAQTDEEREPLWTTPSPSQFVEPGEEKFPEVPAENDKIEYNGSFYLDF